MYASSRLRRFEISVLPPVHSRIATRETLLWLLLGPKGVERETRPHECLSSDFGALHLAGLDVCGETQRLHL